MGSVSLLLYFLVILFSAEVAVEAARAALRGGISVVSKNPFMQPSEGH